MRLGKFFLCLVLTLGVGSVLVAADAPTTQPAEAKPMRARRLTMPWSMVKSLTPEQITQIEKMHSDTIDQLKKIEAKEKDDIMALLTPAQVAELKAAEAKHKAEITIKRKEAATQP